MFSVDLLIRVFFFPIRPSLLKVYNIALAVENFILNSKAASLMVHCRDNTRFIKPNLYLGDILEYFFESIK